MSLGLNFTGNKLQTLSLFHHTLWPFLCSSPPPSPTPAFLSAVFYAPPTPSVYGLSLSSCRVYSCLAVMCLLEAGAQALCGSGLQYCILRKAFSKQVQIGGLCGLLALPDSFIACIIAYDFLIDLHFTLFYFPY